MSSANETKVEVRIRISKFVEEAVWPFGAICLEAVTLFLLYRHLRVAWEHRSFSFDFGDIGVVFVAFLMPLALARTARGYRSSSTFIVRILIDGSSVSWVNLVGIRGRGELVSYTTTEGLRDVRLRLKIHPDKGNEHRYLSIPDSWFRSSDIRTLTHYLEREGAVRERSA